MTDFLFPVDVLPMRSEEIFNPDYEYHHQALNRARVDAKSQSALDVQNTFNFCNSRSLYCVLCIWRDGNWSLCYKLKLGWPEDGKPRNGQRERAYLESKNNHKHFFCLDGDYPDTYPHFCLKRAA